jgi:acyl-CoA thioesterase YciA
MSESLVVPSGEPVIRTVAMPEDTNPASDIFGGWMMAQMDLAAGNAAAHRARGRCATLAADGMVFHQNIVLERQATRACDRTLLRGAS